MTITNSVSNKQTSYKGTIAFAIIALFIYGAWTKLRVDDCLIDARNAYENEWAAACKTTAKSEKEGYADCIHNQDTSESICKSVWNPNRNTKANCALPTKIADRIDSRLERNKNFCVSYG